MTLQRLFATACLLLAGSAPLLAAPAAPASTGSPNSPAAPAAEVTTVPATSDSAAAKALLERAVARYRSDGDTALAAFSRIGEFQKGDLYVYVLGGNGVMKASGGPSVNLVGRNISELKDPEGKAFIREILDGAKSGAAGMVKYRWLNRQHGKIEQKVAYFQSVGEDVVVVGYYVPRASAEQAQALLWRAVHELKQDPQAAIRAFNELNGGFVQDDLYVFVVGVEDMRMHAHGAQPRLVGQDVTQLRDPAGKPIIREMTRLSHQQGTGEITYLWRNPVTQQTEKKTTFYRRVGKYVVAVGAYAPER